MQDTMGIKGDRLTGNSTQVATSIAEQLQSIGGISTRKMFGGYGVFHEDTMFGIVNSGGELYFKVNESNRPRYEKAGSYAHGKMPYYSVPQVVLNDQQSLTEWARASIILSKR